MSVIVKEDISSNCLMGIWQIEEDLDYFRSVVTLDPSETDMLNSFKNYDRQVEWMSVRALLNSLTNIQSKIVYNQERKPFLANNSHNISISHSNKLTSIVLSKHHRVGIDLEYMSHRINNISHKFINPNEYITPNKNQERIHLYIHWCAKEALYKICDKKNINFKDNLTIKPFEIENSGTIIGIHHDTHLSEEFTLTYSIRDNYVIVYCYK
jgi:4'-phosphopantetheinyl transferase